jgi:hypothetical protein
VDLEAGVRRNHPLRTTREIVNAALSDLSKDFDRFYTDFGRPGIAPEKLLRAMLLQAPGAPTDGANGVRSPVSLVRGAGRDDPVWDHSVFLKSRDRLL